MHVRAEDFEPLDPAERWDAAFGPYHIGLCDPDRSEMALVYDARWIATPGPAAQIRDHVVDAIKGYDAVVRRQGWYASPEHTLDGLRCALVAELMAERALDFPGDNALYIVVVELPASRVLQVAAALADFQPFVGHANISWPSDLRTILQTALQAV